MAFLNRWTFLMAACYGQILGGTIYLFGVYSESIKEELLAGESGLQSKVQFLATLSNFGTYLPVAGLFYDTKYGGPRNCIAIGVVIMTASYLVLHLTFAKTIVMDYPMLCVLFFFIGHGAQYFDSTITATVAKNFPECRGQGIGLTKALFGLSASILTIVYLTFFNGSADQFMLFLSVFAFTIGSTLVLPFLRLITPDVGDPTTSKRFSAGFSIVGLHALFLAICSMLRATGGMPISVSFVGDFCFFVLLSVPAWACLWGTGDSLKGDVEDAKNNEYTALTDAPKSDDPSADDVVKGDNSPKTDVGVTNQLSLGGALKTLNFYFLWFILFAGFGAGLTIANNSAQIFKAFGQGANASIGISLVSVLNCFGRISSGMVSDYLLQKHGVSRPLFLAAASAVNVACFLLLSTGTTLGLYVGSLTVGFTFGSFFALGPAVASEVFGLKHFASIYSAFIFSAAAGSYVYSSSIAVAVYEANIGGDGKECYGTACYRLTFLILSASALVSTVSCMLLARNTRHIYASK